jgi:hypothetical protein
MFAYKLGHHNSIIIIGFIASPTHAYVGRWRNISDKKLVIHVYAQY